MITPILEDIGAGHLASRVDALNSIVPNSVSRMKIYLSDEDASTTANTCRLYRHYIFLIRTVKQTTKGIIFIIDETVTQVIRSSSEPQT